MKLEFRDLEIGDKEIFDRILGKDHKHFGWEYNFTMTWMWNVFGKTMICDLGDMVFIRTTYYENCVFSPPFLKNPDDLQKAIAILVKATTEEGCKLDIRGLTKEQADSLDANKFRITSNRNNSDYIYLTEELIELSGRKFHSKRNFISRFKRMYDYTFREYEDKDRDKILALYDDWDESAVHETLDLEKKVIKNALKHRNELNVKIAVLEVEDEIIAFSIIDNSNPFVAHTLIEKADIEFQGAYQAINNLVAEKYFKNNLYVNREEDMGIEGLRKAKLSYNPARLLDKYRIRLKESLKVTAVAT